MSLRLRDRRLNRSAGGDVLIFTVLAICAVYVVASGVRYAMRSSP